MSQSDKFENEFTKLWDWISSLDEHSKKIYLNFSDELCTGRPGNNWFPGCYEIEIFKSIIDRKLKSGAAFAEFQRMHKALEMKTDEEASWNMLMSGWNMGIQELKRSLLDQVAS